MAVKKRKKEDDILMYKSKPLVRKDNVLYYGNPQDKFIIMMTINDTRVENDLELATHVTVALQTNTTGGKGKEKIIKKVEREGLYRALDIAEVWLETSLEDS